jgi:hypothetical protein
MVVEIPDVGRVRPASAHKAVARGSEGGVGVGLGIDMKGRR